MALGSTEQGKAIPFFCVHVPSKVKAQNRERGAEFLSCIFLNSLDA